MTTYRDDLLTPEEETQYLDRLRRTAEARMPNAAAAKPRPTMPFLPERVDPPARGLKKIFRPKVLVIAIAAAASGCTLWYVDYRETIKETERKNPAIVQVTAEVIKHEPPVAWCEDQGIRSNNPKKQDLFCSPGRGITTFAFKSAQNVQTELKLEGDYRDHAIGDRVQIRYFYGERSYRYFGAEVVRKPEEKLTRSLQGPLFPSF